MLHVQGAVVVRRPDLIDVSSDPSLLAPASDLDFVRTLQSYFSLFQSSLFSRCGVVVGGRVEFFVGRVFRSASHRVVSRPACPPGGKTNVSSLFHRSQKAGMVRRCGNGMY